MGGIGIVGTGISGLHLGLYLQSAGVDTTVYTSEATAQHRAGRLPNLVVRWAPTVARERRLGVLPGGDEALGVLHVRVAGDPPVAFCGRLPAPAATTDFRIYLPTLLERYESRGGRVVVGPCPPADLARLADRHELVVVAAGRDGFGGVFPRDPARSPHATPARHITAGLYDGLRWPEPTGVEYVLIPGMGEIFQIPFRSFDGPVSGVAVSGLPGTALAELAGFDRDGDPAGFVAALTGLLARFAPSILERADRSRFGPPRPQDVLQGRLTPVVRQGWAPLGNGRHALAIGDAWILNDPVAAQGANLGSRCAFVLGEAIAAGGPYDEAFCQRVEQALWGAAAAPTLLSNAMLEPPTPAVVDVLVRAGRDQAEADRFAAGFGDPEGLLAMLAGERAGCR